MLNSKNRRRRWAPWVLTLSVAAATFGGWVGVRWYQENRACQRREAALEARIAQLKREVGAKLPPGTNREQVEQLLKEKGMYLSYSDENGRVEGTIIAEGCSGTFACGDEVLIVLDVFIDNEGRVSNAPQVETRYENCM